MDLPKKAVALACRMDSERVFKLSKRILDFLTKKGEIVNVEGRIAPIFPLYIGKELISMTSENTKFLIAIGGDGTLLRVVGCLPQQDPPPILGVNVGSVGFLDESNEHTVFRDLNQILNEEYTIEECYKIIPYIIKDTSEEVKLNNALNEILIISSKASKILQISIKINNIFLNRSYLDGLIISTSMGSTAYNLSAGGAIVNPNLKVMQITPLNSFARTGLKPLIIPIDSEVEVKLLRPRLNAKIIIDGQIIIKKIQPNTRIVIRKSDGISKFIRLAKNNYDNYFDRLRKKIIGILKVPIDESSERQ